MADVTMNANFDNYTSFTAKFGVVINSVVVDPEVTEESSNPVASSGIYKFVEEEIQKGSKVKDVIVEDESIVDEEGKAIIPLADEETKGLVGEGYGFEVKGGYPQAAVYSKTIFNQLKDFLFISKGTLLNVLAGFQTLLESGKNIKTINGQSILGEGDLPVGGGSGNVDDVLVDGTSVLGSDKIARIPKASSEVSGTIKIGNGAQVNSAGTIRATALSKENYDSANGNTFVGKTTLENVLNPIREEISGRADVSLSNIDADGEEKIKEVAETEAIKTDLTSVKA
ncbi:MAG: hypothetical protein KBT03_10410, partial [Bacteroidales bacterium]|nr:hypothetical protein [Candidatus Scybalousia scybalohippi]